MGINCADGGAVIYRISNMGDLRAVLGGVESGDIAQQAVFS